MTGKVTDEMLMAFVDGETDDATAAMIEKALAADPALAERAENFRVSRKLLREAFGSSRDEPVPERLVKAAMGDGDTGKVTPFRRRPPMSRFALPLAASLALAVGIAGYLAGQAGGGTGDAFGRAALAEALAGTKSGERRTVEIAGQGATFETLATYRIEGGLCRSFDLSGQGLSLTGIGCDSGSGWNVDITVAKAGGDGSFSPASDAALESVDAYLDALEASAPLGPEEEAELDAR